MRIPLPVGRRRNRQCFRPPTAQTRTWRPVGTQLAKLRGQGRSRRDAHWLADAPCRSRRVAVFTTQVVRRMLRDAQRRHREGGGTQVGMSATPPDDRTQDASLIPARGFDAHVVPSPDRPTEWLALRLSCEGPAISPWRFRESGRRCCRERPCNITAGGPEGAMPCSSKRSDRPAINPRARDRRPPGEARPPAAGGPRPVGQVPSHARVH